MITTNIRELYKPVQPTVRKPADLVTYMEVLPDPRLQNIIYCYWQLKTSEKLSEQFNYRVVADACIDVYFEPDNPQENYVMGFCKKFTEFPLDHTFNYIGVRFLPTMFPQLFRINAAELSNRYEHLHMVVPQLSNFISDHFTATQRWDEIRPLLDNYFLQLAAKTAFHDDSRLYEAIEIILENSGVVNIEKDLN